MSEEKERELYWEAQAALQEIIDAGAGNKTELLEELEGDLGD